MPSNSPATSAPCSLTCVADNSKAAARSSPAPRSGSSSQHRQASPSQALEIDANLRDLIADEPEFNPLRHDPDFVALTGAMA
jgi:hypothetical protein